MILHKKIKFIYLVSSAVIAIFPKIALAANAALEKLQDVGNKDPNAAYEVANATTISEIVGTGVSALLALIGVIFIVLMIYAGYNWMTARGEEEKVTKAKDTIFRAIIGLIIVVGAYAIWAFVFYNFII